MNYSQSMLRQKAGYQSRIIIAQAVVFLLAGGLAFWSSMQEPALRSGVTGLPPGDGIHKQEMPGDDHGGRVPASAYLTSPREAAFHGQIGVRFVIVPDPVTVDLPTIQTYRPEPAPSFKLSVGDGSSADLIYEDEAGGGPIVSMDEVDEWYYVPEMETITIADTSYYPIVVLDTVAPKMPERARKEQREGVAVVQLLIDDRGRIAWFDLVSPEDTLDPTRKVVKMLSDGSSDTMWFSVNPGRSLRSFPAYVLIEEPPEYDFAQALLAVLLEWKFQPAMVGDRCVPSFLTIEWNFRFCNPLEVDCWRSKFKVR